jgi:hypothetical protein
MLASWKIDIQNNIFTIDLSEEENLGQPKKRIDGYNCEARIGHLLA